MRTSSVEKKILETLSNENAHLTSLQVFNEIRKNLPAVNQSTVYRALERMVKRGVVSISDMGTQSAVYELITDRLHHHLVCQICGNVITIEHEEVKSLFTELQNKYNFDIVTKHLVLFGTCSQCQ